jgi:hypothetical protein
MTDHESIKLILRSSVDDDPFVGSHGQYAQDLKLFLAIAEENGGRVVPPKLAMDSAIVQHVLAFEPLIRDSLKYVVGPAIVAWIAKKPCRKIEVGVDGIHIKATTVEEAQQLIDKLLTATSASADDKEVK